MICPECRAEYRQGITRCADCKVDLVESVPDVDHESPEMVQLCELQDPAALLAIESALAGAGIPFQIEDESAVPGATLAGLDPMGRAAVVLVPRARAEEARLLLHEDEEDEDADDEDDEDDDDWDSDDDESNDDDDETDDEDWEDEEDWEDDEEEEEWSDDEDGGDDWGDDDDDR